MNDDLISRQYLQKQFQDKCKGDCLVCDYDSPYGCCLIDNAPSVTPEQTREWIPIGERLPEDRDWYLGIFKEPDTGWINPIPFICDYVGSKTKATTKENWILRGFTDRDECIDYYFNLECVAWMPLPKPFEPQESEESDADSN